MDDLRENRAKRKEEFLYNLSLGFRGLRKSLLHKLEGKSFKSLFVAIREIINDETESDVQGQPSLMRRLTANNSDTLQDLIHNSLQLSTSNLIKQMVADIKQIKESNKKIEKMFRKYRHKVSSKSSKSKFIALEEELTQKWLVYKRTLHRQTVFLACLDEKLYKLKNKLGQKLKRLLLKYVEKSRKLTRRFRGDSSNSSASGSSSSEIEAEEAHDSPKCEQKKPEPKKVVIKTKKVIRKIITPGLYKITPWPVGDPKGAGITSTRPINYEMFLASARLVPPSSSAETNLSKASSVDSLAGSTSGRGPTPRTIVVAPATSVLTIDALTSEEDHKVAIAAPPSQAWEATPVVEPLEMANVYTKAIKAYRPKDKTDLKLKVGQIVKQKRPADQSGMAYGWTKTRLGIKKYGFFPVSHVVLSEGK